jgi:hypothetical protein
MSDKNLLKPVKGCVNKAFRFAVIRINRTDGRTSPAHNIYLPTRKTRDRYKFEILPESIDPYNSFFQCDRKELSMISMN